MRDIFEKIEGLPIPEGASYTSIPVLEFLNGMPWDEFAMNFVYGLRPRKVRTSTGCLKCDACPTRVTVMLEEDGETIKYIEQEITVGLLGGFENGHDLSMELARRLGKLEDDRYV